MECYKLVKGYEGAEEYARLGGWDSLAHMVSDHPETMTNKFVQDHYWLNEDQETDWEEVSLNDEDFDTDVVTVSLIGYNPQRVYSCEAKVSIIDSRKAWFRVKDFDEVFC